MLFHRLLLKQLVTMEVIQWTSLWNEFMDEFESEKNLLGGSLGDKAAEDLRQRIIEHVIYFQLSYLHNSYAFFFNLLLSLVVHSFATCFLFRISLLFQSITRRLL
jgi:hypothetical protein